MSYLILIFRARIFEVRSGCDAFECQGKISLEIGNISPARIFHTPGIYQACGSILNSDIIQIKAKYTLSGPNSGFKYFGYILYFT